MRVVHKAEVWANRAVSRSSPLTGEGGAVVDAVLIGSAPHRPSASVMAAATSSSTLPREAVKSAASWVGVGEKGTKAPPPSPPIKGVTENSKPKKEVSNQ